MSQLDLQSRLAWIVATLGGLPQTKEIIDLSKEIDASSSALIANECLSPQQPSTLDEETWEIYKAESLARIESQRQKRIEEAKLQRREEQVNRLSEIWSQFLKESARLECSGDAPVQIHRRGRQRPERMFEDTQQQEGQEHPEAVEKERAGSFSARYVPTAQAPSQPETPRTPREEEVVAMTFEDIWNHGNPSDKIIESVPGIGRHYVLRCRRGRCLLLDRHFGANPFRGARAHLRQRHSEELGPDFQFSDSSILQTIGVHVKGCDAALAQKNNAAFVAWYNNAGISWQ